MFQSITRCPDLLGTLPFGNSLRMQCQGRHGLCPGGIFIIHWPGLVVADRMCYLWASVILRTVTEELASRDPEKRHLWSCIVYLKQ